MWVKLRLARGLERCLASVNKQLVKHKIILALDDRGRISCHKVNLCFMYYDPEQCINYLNDFIERSENQGNQIEAGWESRLDVDVNDIVIQGSNTTRVSKRKVRCNIFVILNCAIHKFLHDLIHYFLLSCFVNCMILAFKNDFLANKFFFTCTAFFFHFNF